MPEWECKQYHCIQCVGGVLLSLTVQKGTFSSINCPWSLPLLSIDLQQVKSLNLKSFFSHGRVIHIELTLSCHAQKLIPSSAALISES